MDKIFESQAIEIYSYLAMAHDEIEVNLLQDTGLSGAQRQTLIDYCTSLNNMETFMKELINKRYHNHLEDIRDDA